ncbi:MAG: hypothetical protein AAGG68_10620 [Bacteroidota bacterium]
MNIFVVIEEFVEFSKVNYYTVRLEYDDHIEEDSEMDKFLKKFENVPSETKEEFDDLLALIENIGNRGAYERYFRFEDRANALPKSFTKNTKERVFFVETSIRLYCIRLSDRIVILINGDVKTAQKVQDCPNVLPHFRLANKIARKLDNAIKEKDIQIQGKYLKDLDDFFLSL